MQTLQVSQFPLFGQRLIEASAGTGKTHTITGLYNRLMLGHGHSALDCNQILVVTFTKAATEELRGRLRERISTTMQELLQLKNAVVAVPGSGLAELQHYLDDMEPSAQNVLAERLSHNLALMDEASIYTIHGFCQRMLKQFAFDTGVLFSAEMTLDTSEYLLQACEDIWRQVAYSLDAAQSRALLAHYTDPSALLNRVKYRFDKHDIQYLPVVKAHSFIEAWERFEPVYRQTQHLLTTTSIQELADLIQASGLDKRSYSTRYVPNWLSQTFDFLRQEPAMTFPDGLLRLTPQVMGEKLKEGGVMPEHPFFHQLEVFVTAVSELNHFFARAWFEPIKERFFDLLAKAGVLMPNDLMRLLNDALQSSQGEELAKQIRSLYPVAMIDEFQDTDALQYAIFNTIYPAEQALDSDIRSAPALIMIGDPKQAIYSFRGADIFTYIKVKKTLPASAQFTLDTNYRSHSALIAGVNALFSQHPAPFIYDQYIGFEAVKAAGLRDQRAFTVSETPQVPMQIFLHEEPLSNEDASRLASEQCALKIAELLQGQAHLGASLVQARDIAVLVRSARQAELIRQSLLKQGINSVFLVKDSVFSSVEAEDLYHWLNAIAHPRDERLLRMALSRSIHNYSAESLARLLVDESRWEKALEQNERYHTAWLQQGLMASLLLWLETDGLAETIRQQHNGERVLTNLMHLGDLLQSTSRQLHGHEALLRWFAERVFGDQREGEAAQLRLESDADLVSIVTIHSSKGLQYPLVFLPFLWRDSNELFKGSDCLYYDEDQEQVTVHLAPQESHQALALKANTAENMRLLYVALTRAEQGCFVWLMNNTARQVSMVGNSALGTLLQIQKAGKEFDLIEFKQRMKNLPVYCGELPNWQTTPRAQSAHDHAALSLPTLSDPPFDAWRVSSYSALASNVGQASVLLKEPPLLLKNDEDTVGVEVPSIVVESTHEFTFLFHPEHLAFEFQKGAQAGTCLHEVLEAWDFHDPEQLADLCVKKLQRYGIALDDARLPELQQWFVAMVQTPLATADGRVFQLMDLPKHRRLDEMEFHLPINQLLKPTDVDRLLGAGARFQFMPMQGFLKGFIDLIFEYNGRFYVADYKSNFLGTEAMDYLGESLENAMIEHAYDLQAWIYTLALDAFLRLRLGAEYQPEQHLGGVYYLFLRGMHVGAELGQQIPEGVSQAPGVYFQAPDWKQLQHWRAAFFEETSL